MSEFTPLFANAETLASDSSGCLSPPADSEPLALQFQEIDSPDPPPVWTQKVWTQRADTQWVEPFI